MTLLKASSLIGPLFGFHVSSGEGNIKTRDHSVLMPWLFHGCQSALESKVRVRANQPEMYMGFRV